LKKSNEKINMKIITSPAKLMKVGVSSEFIKPTEPQFIEDSAFIQSYLKEKTPNFLAKLMELSPKLADENWERNQNWKKNPSENESSPALLAFTGEVYRGLDAQSLDKKAIDYLQEHYRMLSGLYGLLKPSDRIMLYRLEMGRKFVIDIGGGSTEMIIGDNFTPLIYESRHMGCVSFAKKFFPNGEISEESFRLAKQSAVNKIEDLAWEYRNLGWQSVLGSSGTIKTVHQVISENIDSDGIVTAERLDHLIQQTLPFSHFEQLKFHGLNPDRADVFVPGLAILRALAIWFHL